MKQKQSKINKGSSKKVEPLLTQNKKTQIKTNDGNSKKKNVVKSLLDLYVTFFKIGSITFGGGLAMLPILERELAEKRHWTTVDEQIGRAHV